MKADEGRAKDGTKPLFEVHQVGASKFYEAAEGVDWLALFPDEQGSASKLIDLPGDPESPVPPASAGTGGRRAVAVLYPPPRKRTSRIVIATSIVAALGAVAFLAWLVSAPTVPTRATSSTTAAANDDRLTTEALGPPLSSPAAVQNARAPGVERNTAGIAAPTPSTEAPQPAIPRSTPTPTPFTTPAVTTRATPGEAAAVTPTAMLRPPPPTLLRDSPSPSPTPTPSPSPSTAAAPTPTPTPTPASTPVNVGAPPPVVPIPNPRPSNSPAAASPSPPPSPSASPPAATPTRAAETAAVRVLLDNYRAAYESLHAETVQAVWPSANTPALARAFSQIASQSVDFYSCGIEFGNGTAEANCSGAVTFVPKVGSKTPQVESRSWTFYLVSKNDRWIIDRVVAK